MIVDHTQQLIGQKSVSRRAFVAGAGLVRETLREFAAPLLKSVAQRGIDDRTRFVAMRFNQFGDGLGDRAPIKDRALARQAAR